MCHCLIRVNVELTVTQQPPWIKAKTAQYSAAPNTYCSYKLHTQSKLLKGNEKETKRNLKNTILAKFDIKPTWACWSLCMWSMSMGLSVFLCNLRVRERERDHLSWSICRSRPSQGSLKLKRGGFHLHSLIFINSGFQIEIKTWGWHNNSVNHSLLISYTHTHTHFFFVSPRAHTRRSRDKWKAWPIEIWG